MASIGQKNGVYHVRFRYNGVEYKKSLKTRDAATAAAARHVIEVTLHRLLTGQLAPADGIDVGDFVVSGGTLRAVPTPTTRRPQLPSTQTLVTKYLEYVRPLVAPTYFESQALHLRHLCRYLGGTADESCDRVTFGTLESYLNGRLAIRHPSTAERERITLLQFYKWAVRSAPLPQSPAAGLPPIKGGEDRPPFRTVSEIESVIGRGGLTREEQFDLWDCLYLSPVELSALLRVVRSNARTTAAHLLHVIPAYTGLRRGELLRLRWVDIDLDAAALSARSRKQSRRKRETTRRVDLHPELGGILRQHREESKRGQFVVSDETAEPLSIDRANREFWQPMLRTDWCLDARRRLFKVGFHTYRHSFASNLAAAGVDQRIIDEFMGHTTEAMRRRYRHLFPTNRQAAIRSFTLDSVHDDDRPTARGGVE